MPYISDSMVVKPSPPRACIRIVGVIIKETKLRGTWLKCRRRVYVKKDA